MVYNIEAKVVINLINGTIYECSTGMQAYCNVGIVSSQTYINCHILSVFHYDILNILT